MNTYHITYRNLRNDCICEKFITHPSYNRKEINVWFHGIYGYGYGIFIRMINIRRQARPLLINASEGKRGFGKEYPSDTK